MKKVTLQDIAVELGLSKFAVSRALSGKDGVSDDTRQRISAKAVEMGYQRLPTLAGERPVIHIVFTDHDPVNSELWMQMQNGIQQASSGSGFQIQSHWTSDATLVANIAEASAGLILVGQHGADAVAAVRRTNRPLVRLGWVQPLEQADQVAGADHEAGSAVGNYLLSRGHRRIGFVHGSRVLRGRMERLFGLREAALTYDDASIYEIQFSPEQTFAECFLNLRLEGDMPTALFCSHDSLGVFVVSELHRLGYSVPHDVSVVGYGDFVAATQISPPLTTVRLPGSDMGIAAFRLLLDRMDLASHQLPPQRVLLVPQIIERESVRVIPEA